MVMTQKSIKDKKSKKFPVKEYNPARKFMTKEQATADSKKFKDDQNKIEDYKNKLKNEPAIPPAEEVQQSETPVEIASEVVPKDGISTETSKKIVKLENKLAGERGPGSKKRKANIQAKIDKLRGIGKE